MTREQTCEGSCPLVSVGLPVFNGENYLAKAIDSILGQTLRNIELVICDNASTDGTQAICEEYARQDARVRYFRNDCNLGAGPNYDLAFHRSRGTFFKWAAHDDCIAPAYLEKTVACLQQHPDAVLCCVGVVEIGPKDEVIRAYTNHLPGIDAPRASIRFAGMILYRHQCEDFFGVFRREALIGSGLHGMYSGSDRVLLAEMALRGRCLMVPEPLFLHREHNDRYTRAILLVDRKKAVAWQDSSHGKKKASGSLFHLVVYRHYWLVVRKNVRDGRERWACYGQLVRWWFVDYHFPDVVKDILAHIHPSLLIAARRIKRALFGTSEYHPGGDVTPVK